MANQYYISAGIIPIDNSSGATANNYYIAAGLVPDDTAAAGGRTTKNTDAFPLGDRIGMSFTMRVD